METRIGVGDPQAIRIYSAKLAVEMLKQAYWRRYMGANDNSIVHELIDLESEKGDTIQYDLSLALRGEGVEGDNRAKGREESLKWGVDEIKIDQIRKPVNAGGAMTRKRTLHDTRKVAKDRSAEWMAQWLDEVCFAYASGLSPTAQANERALFKSTAFAGNPIDAPDAAHIVYGGVATSKASLAATDKMTADLVRRLAAKAEMNGERNPDVLPVQPVNVEGEKRFVLLMSPDQAYDLKSNSSATEWLEIQKAAGQVGSQNPLFTGKLGMIDNVVLQSHARVRRMTDYGAGANVEAHRALLLGRQALGIAYGASDKNGTRMIWKEEWDDFENDVSVLVGTIVGIKKTRFKPKEAAAGTDYGVIAVDTAAKASYTV